MNIEAERFGKILNSFCTLSKHLGYGTDLAIQSWRETESGQLCFILIEKSSNEELTFTLPKPKEQ